MKTPPSREVRMQGGITEGFAETVGLSIYQGSSNELIHGIAAIELTIEAQRAKSARGLAVALRRKLSEDGYIVVSDIDDALEDFLESMQDD